ncbi:MAG: hypothetical protein ACTTKY_00210 [Catonella sp.]
MNKEELIKMRDTLNGWIESFEGDEQEEIEETETPKGLKYKVGDAVILRDNLEHGKFYGGIGFDFSMGYLQNQYSEIQSAKDTHYYINGWAISDEMIDHDKTLYLNSFTKDEREFLSHISDKYEWIAKDGDNDKEVWVYKVYPNRDVGGVWNAASAEVYKLREDVFSFSFDKLGTDEPVRIYKDLNY